MKRLIALLMALMLCLSLCACGDSDETTSKDTPNDEQNSVSTTTSTEEHGMDVSELLENAVLIDGSDFFEEVYENVVSAEYKYDGKVVLFSAQINEIQKDYIVIGLDPSTGMTRSTTMTVYLPTEDIVTVSNGQTVLVAGAISNIALGVGTLMNDYVTVDMRQGYLVQNPETDNEPLYQNAKNLLTEGNYEGSMLLFKYLEGYSDSNDLLIEAACKLAFYSTDGNKSWKILFNKLNATALTGEEIQEIIVGDWYAGVDTVSTYSENGDYSYNGGSGFVWSVENNRLIRESQFTRSEIIIYPFYKNAYVFCWPKAYNSVSDDVYELKFLNGPLE